MVSREFYFFRKDKESVSQRLMINDEVNVAPCDSKKVESLSPFCDFEPSWQNSMASILRAGEDVECVCADIDGQCVGYCIFDVNSGDITQIAVDRNCRRNRIATTLLANVVDRIKAPIIKVINTEIPCESIERFLENVGIEIAGKQYEMIREI